MSKRLFDKELLMESLVLRQGGLKQTYEDVLDFIDSEIRRNVKEAVERIETRHTKDSNEDWWVGFWKALDLIESKKAEVKKEWGIKED